MSRPLIWLLLGVAVVGISSSAPVTAATAAAPLAVAFWRNLVGAGVTATYVAARERGALASLDRVTIRTALLSGLLLAVHFATWLSSLKLTSVTAATAIGASTPVWIVAVDLLRRIRVPRPVLLGVVLAVAGVVAITGVDAGSSARALAGDLLALAGAISVAGYVLLGADVRERTTTAVYTLAAYSTCAAVVLPVCVLAGVQLTGFSAATWVELAVITLGAQLLGHTLLNATLPMIGATATALVTLLEVPGAALIAWAWLDQAPPPTIIPGTVLMLAGLVVVVLARPPGDPIPA
jgi:drug/metabolite transporter (DMT)-like permease